MVQAFNRLVAVRATAAIASFGVLAACQCNWFQTAGSASAPEADEAAEAALPCPDVTEAEAWVNRMPTIGSEPTKMIVTLRVDSKESWMLTPLDMPAAAGLMLGLKPGGASVPGTVAYRQMAPAPLPSQIRILCEGREVAVIEDVMIVQ